LPFTKLRREIEPRWVSEYVLTHYAGFPASFRTPLGPVPQDWITEHGQAMATRMYRPWRPEVDAIVYLPKVLILIEAKIMKYMDGLGKILLYKEQVPISPDLKEHADKEILMELLLPVEVSWVTATAIRVGVKPVVWAPDWVLKIWEERNKYWEPEQRLLREQRKKVLRDLGYE